jgi:hypothetical protein
MQASDCMFNEMLHFSQDDLYSKAIINSYFLVNKL